MSDIGLYISTFRSKTQNQVARRARELDKKTRALAILLRDDWAKAVLEREREVHAVRSQLAQTEADLDEQLDIMSGLSTSKERGERLQARRSSPLAESYERAVNVGGHERGDDPRESEVFLGGTGAGIGMVALQVAWIGGETSSWLSLYSGAFLVATGRWSAVQSGTKTGLKHQPKLKRRQVELRLRFIQLDVYDVHRPIAS